jgi:hypothetical protein
MAQRKRADDQGSLFNSGDCARQLAAIQHRRIHHRGFHMLMSEEFLDGPDGIALLEEMRRETMAKGLAADVFIEPHRMTGLAHSLLQTASLV